MGGKTTGLRASDFQSIWKEIKDAGFILEVGGNQSVNTWRNKHQTKNWFKPLLPNSFPC